MFVRQERNTAQVLSTVSQILMAEKKSEKTGFIDLSNEPSDDEMPIKDNVDQECFSEVLSKQQVIMTSSLTLIAIHIFAVSDFFFHEKIGQSPKNSSYPPDLK